MSVHTCFESLDPRHAGYCACGKRMEETPRPRRRDIDLEREITQQAAKGYVDPERIIALSEYRAEALSGEYVDDPMLIQPGRDRLKDGREEALDARNHLVWWLCENIGDERGPRILRALTYFMLAFQELENED